MSSILIPVILVVAVGLVAGVILTIASRLMFVKVDETVAALREVLPGANCGACGFAGCDDYAAALGADKSMSTALCPVGGADVAASLAGILGVEAGAADPKVAIVLCKGNTKVTNRIMEYARPMTCQAANQFYGGQWACNSGCLGLGDCVEACDFDAINIIDGVAVVDRNNCVGCGACAKTCPKNVITIGTVKNLVYVGCRSNNPGPLTMKSCKVGCIGCKKCQKVCKFEAITVENNLASIDLEKCKNCGLCEKECPTKAIVNLRQKKAPKKPAQKAVEAPKENMMEMPKEPSKKTEEKETVKA